MEDAIKTKAAHGVIWSAFQRFSSQGIGFIISIILARLLLPGDYGIVSLSLVFLAIFRTINESGFSLALINKQDRDELDYSSVLVINVLIGCVLYLLLFLTADSISYFFNQPRLSGVLKIIGICTIIDGFSIVQVAIFTISVNFKIQARVSIIAVIISGLTGIFCAYNGYAFWALVIQSLIYSLVNTTLLWYYSTWRPRRLVFSFERIRSLFDFSYKLVLARLINTIFIQLYPVVIGRVFSVELLGLFDKAKQFETQTSNNIANVVMRVSIPLMCEVQDSKERLNEVLAKFIKATSFLVFPLLTGMIVLAYPLVIVVLSEKWVEAAWILQVLCPTGMFYIISTFNINIFNATGRTGLALQSEVIKKIIFILFIFLSINLGFKYLVWAQLLTSLIEMIVSMLYTKKQIGTGLLNQILSIKNVIISSFIMGGVVSIVTSYIDLNIFKLIVGFLCGCIVYFLYWFIVEPKYLYSIVTIFKKK